MSDFKWEPWDKKPNSKVPDNPLGGELMKALAFYGDICAQHQSAVHFGRFTVEERNLAIRESINTCGLAQLITSEADKRVEAVLDRLYEQLMEEGETIVHQWQVEETFEAERQRLNKEEENHG